MEIIVKPKQNSISEAIGSIINAGLFITIAIYFLNRNVLLSILLICGAMRFSIYQMIDLWFNKTIFLDNGIVFVRCWGIKFRLSQEKSFLRIDNMFVLSPINAKFPTLNIYRNPSSVIGRLFKNKIKLYTITKANIEASRKEAQRISEVFGIQFKDVYEVAV